MEKYKIVDDGELDRDWADPISLTKVKSDKFLELMDKDPTELLHFFFEITVIPLTLVIGTPWLVLDWACHKIIEHIQKKGKKKFSPNEITQFSEIEDTESLELSVEESLRIGQLK